VPYKGFDVLLEAVRKLRAQLIIIGIGPQFDNLRQLIEQYGLQNRVFLVGHQSRDEMKIVFHAARAFAFPSTTAAEAFGLVQLEAMATGLPVVNTSLPTAVPHVARAGVEALTVPPRDSNALRDAIAYLLEHPTECARLGAAGAKRAVDSFSPSEFATRTRAVFDDAVKARETLRRSQSRSVPEKDAR
jgi:rhamnosyl/mannosyltransferase